MGTSDSFLPALGSLLVSFGASVLAGIWLTTAVGVPIVPGGIASLAGALPLFALSQSSRYLVRGDFWKKLRLGGPSGVLLGGAGLSGITYGLTLKSGLYFVGFGDRPTLQFGVAFLAGAVIFVAHFSHFLGLRARADASRAEVDLLTSELSRKESELRSLGAKLSPHFLFNALNSLTALISKDPVAARSMCTALADFLRQSLRADALETIPLGEELDTVRNYVAIEKFRFGERLSFGLSAEFSERAVLPRFVLQPLVENAVKHGVGRMLEPCSVRLDVREAGDFLEVLVENDCEPEGAARASAARGLGLRLTRERLDHLSGGRSAFEAAREGNRYRVQFRYPLPVEAQ